MSDRVKKPGTTTYLLRDVPKAQLAKAKKVLAARPGQQTLKQVFIQSVERLAAIHDRRAPRSTPSV